MTEPAKVQSIDELKTIPVPTHATTFHGNVISFSQGSKLDLVALRDCLLELRASVYCAMCKCPNWDMSRDEKMLHYEGCKLGQFTELLLTIVPKEKTSIKWKPE